MFKNYIFFLHASYKLCVFTDIQYMRYGLGLYMVNSMDSCAVKPGITSQLLRVELLPGLCCLVVLSPA